MCGPVCARSFFQRRSQTCNRVIHIQPCRWIAAPSRTGLSGTHIFDNVCTNMEWIKNELRKSSSLTEFLQRTITCWPGKTPRSRSGLRRALDGVNDTALVWLEVESHCKGNYYQGWGWDLVIWLKLLSSLLHYSILLSSSFISKYV